MATKISTTFPQVPVLVAKNAAKKERQQIAFSSRKRKMTKAARPIVADRSGKGELR
jgi:hypothetical protein